VILDFVQPICRYGKIKISTANEHHSGIKHRDIGQLRSLSYIEQWKHIRSQSLYHLLLDDQSIISFQDVAGKISYSYLPCPLEIPSKSSFLEMHFPDRNQRRDTTDMQEQYNLTIDSADFRPHITPIRYDIDWSSYRENIHPAAHLHFGIDNNIRLATKRVLSPKAFFLLVIRQAFPENWSAILHYRDNLKLERAIRTELSEVDSKYWSSNDDIQHFLI
jgi:hypothetical protein